MPDFGRLMRNGRVSPPVPTAPDITPSRVGPGISPRPGIPGISPWKPGIAPLPTEPKVAPEPVPARKIAQPKSPWKPKIKFGIPKPGWDWGIEKGIEIADKAAEWLVPFPPQWEPNFGPDFVPQPFKIIPEKIRIPQPFIAPAPKPIRINPRIPNNIERVPDDDRADDNDPDYDPLLDPGLDPLNGADVGPKTDFRRRCDKDGDVIVPADQIPMERRGIVDTLGLFSEDTIWIEAGLRNTVRICTYKCWNPAFGWQFEFVYLRPDESCQDHILK
jgi:hypothetical protein